MGGTGGPGSSPGAPTDPSRFTGLRAQAEHMPRDLLGAMPNVPSWTANQPTAPASNSPLVTNPTAPPALADLAPMQVPTPPAQAGFTPPPQQMGGMPFTPDAIRQRAQYFTGLGRSGDPLGYMPHLGPYQDETRRLFGLGS